ncbi:MAG: ATP synthase F1 subunit epsilon [Bacteroidales bacterium]|nr:ATP synthase F1 subunit epsilon [Bacteroidales bacterium]
MKELHLRIVSPERTVFEGQVAQVTLPGEAGRFQVLFNHAALISSLTEGDIRFTVGSESRTVRIAGGFVEVNDNETSVCAEL